MADKDTLVICPLYNEQDYLQDFYPRLRSNYSLDILFVDDGSTDSGEEFLLSIPDVHTLLIRHPQRLGYGAALRSGFSFALLEGYKRIVTMDVDLQHNPDRLSGFFDELDNSEVVLGSRYLSISSCFNIPRSRLVINRYIAQLFEVKWGIHFDDPFCGFRGYRDSFLRQAVLREESYGLALEILLEVIRLNYSFKEIPIEAIYNDPRRIFLDGLNGSRKRLLYYLKVIERGVKRKNGTKTVSCGKSSS